VFTWASSPLRPHMIPLSHTLLDEEDIRAVLYPQPGTYLHSSGASLADDMIVVDDVASSCSNSQRASAAVLSRLHTTLLCLCFFSSDLTLLILCMCLLYLLLSAPLLTGCCRFVTQFHTTRTSIISWQVLYPLTCRLSLL
jgi:hypothetical protein